MEFKVGKTCNGCDQIIKNMNKMTNVNLSEKVEDSIGGEVAKADVGKFLKETSGHAEKTSKHLVKKMNDNARVKGRK